MSGDYMVHTLAYDARVRAVAITSKNVVEEFRKRHDLSPLATAAIGRVASAALMLSAWASENERITIIFEGDGPIGRIVVEAKPDHTVRGYVGNPKVDLPLKDDGKLDVGRAIGKGTLYIVRDIGLKNPFTGQVNIVSGEVAKDLAYYFTVSEQIPSAVSLGVLVGRNGVVEAGGYIIQIFGGQLEEWEIDEIEGKVKDSPAVTELLKSGMRPEDILKNLLGEHLMEMYRYDVGFKCDCDRERAFNALRLLPIHDLKELLKEGKAEVTCKWCGAVYIFEKKDIESIILEREGD